MAENASSWKDSFYNPRTGEVLGRTASSWALILLFYLVFYCFLAGMFALTMWVLLLTLDDYVPRYRDRIPTPGSRGINHHTLLERVLCI
uniref:Sodium/potassium-transporting ATPase subunit beta-3 n=1 Tax=Nothobranchius furzeri TaxID=105023 RepID=A0A8C6MC09_NOTFU